jgi:polysaccharide pyruvyl transferase WcaK-like protein
MVRKIGLLNHMGAGNLGDDATQAAVIQQIRSRWPEAEIVLFSMNPADTCSRHGMRSYPIRRERWIPAASHFNGSKPVTSKNKDALRRYRVLFQFLRVAKAATTVGPGRAFREFLFLARSFLVVRSLDLFIVSGGGQLLDSWGGPWKFPFTVFKWIFLAKLSRTKCYFLNVGAGPLVHPLARWFVKNALDLADYVSFRDPDSRHLVESAGYKGKSHVAADCVYALDPPPPKLCAAEREHPTVGLSPMAYCDPRVYWQKDQGTYERLVHTVASFGGWLRDNDYRLALFSTDIWFDLRTLEELKIRLEAGANNAQRSMVQQEQIERLDQLLSRIQAMDYVVTCRFHGVVFAHLLNKPVLALSHHPKVSTLMTDLGLERYCLDIRKCDVNMLQDTFLSLVGNRDEIKGRMADKAACYKRTVLTQFDQLFLQRATI